MKMVIILISLLLFSIAYSDSRINLSESMEKLSKATERNLMINNLILEEISKNGSITPLTATEILNKIEKIYPEFIKNNSFIHSQNKFNKTKKNETEEEIAQVDLDYFYKKLDSNNLAINSTVPAGEVIGLLTGSKFGTYYQFGKDIATATRRSGINVLVKSSKDPIDNIKRIFSLENATLAIVQSDILGFLRKSNNPKFRKYAKHLRLIYPLYKEEIHLFAHKNIQTLTDLSGKIVVVGPNSSGVNITAWNILNMSGVVPGIQLNSDVRLGIKMVLLGEADAVFVVGSKPQRVFSNLFSTFKDNGKQLLKNFHFVPLDNLSLLSEYESSYLSSEDYSFIKGKTIPIVSVKNLLVSFDFSSGKSTYYKKNCSKLRILAHVIRENLDSLKTMGHQKWKQVDLESRGGTRKWVLDKCSHNSDFIIQQNHENSNDIECALNGTC